MLLKIKNYIKLGQVTINGEKEKSGQYGGHSRIGKWEYFNSMGNKILEEFYENGKMKL